MKHVLLISTARIMIQNTGQHYFCIGKRGIIFSKLILHKSDEWASLLFINAFSEQTDYSCLSMFICNEESVSLGRG